MTGLEKKTVMISQGNIDSRNRLYNTRIYSGVCIDFSQDTNLPNECFCEKNRYVNSHTSDIEMHSFMWK